MNIIFHNCSFSGMLVTVLFVVATRLWIHLLLSPTLIVYVT